MGGWFLFKSSVEQFLCSIQSGAYSKPNFQKQPPKGILRKGCSENIQQIYRRKPCRSVICNFIEITLRHGCSLATLLHIFRTPFIKNTSGQLLLNFNVSITVSLIILIVLYRSNHRSCSVGKGVLKNFAKFTGKHRAKVSFLIKLHASACNFIKKETLAQVLSCEFCEISKNTFSYRTPLGDCF